VTHPDRAPTPYTYNALIALALADLVWAGWLWFKLISARGGGAAECAIGGGATCAAVWDSPFANLVHEYTLIPVAGWGVIWALAAILLPAAVRLSSHASRWWSATLIHAALGALGALVLVLAMYGYGRFCSDCAITYGITLAYAWVALRYRHGVEGGDALLASLGRVLGVGAACYLLVLYPAIQTPRSASVEAVRALRLLEVPEGGPAAERQLAAFLKQLDEEEVRQLADMLATYRAAPAVPLRPARTLIGPPGARVRMTEFVDALCGHCASLHELVADLRRKLPYEAFALEPRHFPLDAECNPSMSSASQQPVRCTAAKVMICSEQQPWAFELAGEIFENQQRLDEALLYQLAGRHISPAALRSCVGSSTTDAHLGDDVDWALQHRIEGTPMVLLNGRKAIAHPPFLIAMLLAGADPDHPLLAKLPPGRAISR
jgi:serine/threonine-protein kinase